MRRNLAGCAVAVLLLAAGCTIINSFEDVQPRTEGTYAAADPSAIDGAASDAQSGPDASDGGDAGPALAGAIVVGGRVDDDAGASTYVLTALDPASGREITTRESMAVAGIRYDGLRDLWYIFESKSRDFVPGQADEVVLHVRTLDLRSGAWTELSSRVVPTLQSYDSIGVVTERIGYVAYTSPDAGTPGALELVTLSTTNPAAITEISRLPIDVTPLGAIATRSAVGTGGNVNLVRMVATPAACPGNTCTIEIVPVRIPNGAGSPVMDPPVPVGTASRFALPGYGSFTEADRDLVIIPRASNDASAPTLAGLYEPRTHALEGSETPFFMTDSTLRRAAVSDCTGTAFVVGTNTDLSVHAVPVLGDGTGKPTKASTGHSGQSVYFEPTSKTVFAPFTQGSGFDFSPFRLAGTREEPALVKRTAADWKPPPDLRPLLLGIRQTVPLPCP